VRAWSRRARSGRLPERVTYSGELTGVPNGDAPSFDRDILYHHARISTSRPMGRRHAGDQGGRFAGWGFYLLKGKHVHLESG